VRRVVEEVDAVAGVPELDVLVAKQELRGVRRGE
jgi:hypothetical protein